MKESQTDLKREFQDDPDYRYAYAEDFLNASIATQIVVIREQRELSQKELGELIGTKQPGVSRLEDVNHSTWKTETLKRIARALGVRLKITFETFGTLLGEDRNFGRAALRRPSFKDDPAWKEKEVVGEGVVEDYQATPAREQIPIEGSTLPGESITRGANTAPPDSITKKPIAGVTTLDPLGTSPERVFHQYA